MTGVSLARLASIPPAAATAARVGPERRAERPARERESAAARGRAAAAARRSMRAPCGGQPPPQPQSRRARSLLPSELERAH